ncbi:MAG: hypothetical protein QMD71_02795 [bacterium]|nr:hypothetical protein [bacterium]
MECSLDSPLSSGLFLYDVCFPTEKEGWAVGSGYSDMPDSLKILHYSSGRWCATHTGISIYCPFSVYFVNIHNGWVVDGACDLIYYYETGIKEKDEKKYRMPNTKCKIASDLS